MTTGADFRLYNPVAGGDQLLINKLNKFARTSEVSGRPAGAAENSPARERWEGVYGRKAPERGAERTAGPGS